MAASSVFEDVVKSCKLSWVVDVYYSSYKQKQKDNKNISEIDYKLDLQTN